MNYHPGPGKAIRVGNRYEVLIDWIVAKDLQLLAMIFNLMGFYHHQSCSVCHCCCYSDANESGNRINLFAFRQIGMIMFHV